MAGALRLRRFRKNNIARFTIACSVFAAGVLGAQAAPANGARLADSVLADLTKLSALEGAYFAANGHYTDDLAVLAFKPATSAVIAVSYASARMFSASASHVRLAPFVCFAMVSADTVSHPDKPFCTDSRYGTAAAALARVGTLTGQVDSAPHVDSATARPVTVPPPSRKKAVKKRTPSVESPVAPAVISPQEFALRLQAVARGAPDSAEFVVQFAVRDARYDPERGVLEVAVDRVPLPISATDSTRPAVVCLTQPAFACGSSGLAYIARGLLRVPPERAPSADVLSTGLVLRARFAVVRRRDARGPALTLLALVLQSKGDVVARWAPAPAP